MDPNANLQEQEHILTNPAPIGAMRDDAARLLDLRQALAHWLDHGGFAPDWAACPTAAAWYRRRRQLLTPRP